MKTVSSHNFRSLHVCNYQRWSRGHKARGQGQGHKKKSEAKAKNSLSEDRHSRGQGQECSRPRPKRKCSPKKKKGLHKNFSGNLQKIKKKVVTKIFQAIPTKKRFQKKIFQALHKLLTIQNIVPSSSRGQANFRGFEASRPRPQGQGLDLRGQGQGLQNVSSRPRTSSRTPPLVIM